VRHWSTHKPAEKWNTAFNFFGAMRTRRKLARLAAATWNKRRTEVDGHNKTPHDLILICFLDSWQKTLLRETRIARKLKDLLQNDFKEPDGPWQTEALSGLGT
jgi:hypothetical protein